MTELDENGLALLPFRKETIHYASANKLNTTHFHSFILELEFEIEFRFPKFNFQIAISKQDAHMSNIECIYATHR